MVDNELGRGEEEGDEEDEEIRQDLLDQQPLAPANQPQKLVGTVPGLWIRSIFGRIRILQIRILKSDPDPVSYWDLKNQFKHLNFFDIKHISSVI